MTKIYLVRYGCYSDQGIAGVFSTEEKAQRYCDIYNKLGPAYYDGDYYVDEYELDREDLPEDTKVVAYYSAWIALVDVWNWDHTELLQKAGELDWEVSPENEIYTKPVVIERSRDDMIVIKSTTSLEHAKKVAIEQYQIFTQQRLENGEI